MSLGHLAALDLGSGTIKLSVFQRQGGRWAALLLEEANTELRRGLGPELTLKPGPIADTLEAVTLFQAKAQAFGVQRLPAYATSAVRKARNPEALLAPLQVLGIGTTVLSEEDEGRLNLLGATARLGRGLGAGQPPAPGYPAPRCLVIDPGGDSTECTADLTGEGWRKAQVASLPFGSVSLQEGHGSASDNQPIAWEALRFASAAARVAALKHPAFGAFIGAGLTPALRINAPIQRALEQVNGRPLTPHGEGGLYRRAELEALCRHTAALDHGGRAALLKGEPLGKVDRTCYGFASWLGILDALGAEQFQAEPWGIKLGAVIALNGLS